MKESPNVADAAAAGVSAGAGCAGWAEERSGALGGCGSVDVVEAAGVLEDGASAAGAASSFVVSWFSAAGLRGRRRCFCKSIFRREK